MHHFYDRLASLRQIQGSLLPFHYGLEKESLRVAPDGLLAQSPHPLSLGSALTHPSITTDYSEALLELVTPVFTDHASLLTALTELHQFSQDVLADQELLWAASMPCRLPPAEQIPLAQYGPSNSGRMKTLYRKGLGYRYGRPMQTIAGVHYNLSFNPGFWSDWHQLLQSPLPLRQFIDQQYFAVIRNFRRLVWLVPYLFGASPALCKCFVQQPHAALHDWDEASLFGPYATSLRMSELGYQNKLDLGVRFNELSDYLQRLEQAIRTPHADFAAIGVQVDGEYRQLNANLLQIENEYYSSIRPKQPPKPGERPAKALRERGIAYLEVRALDLDPYSPIGVQRETLAFIDLLLLYCLLTESPVSTDADEAELQDNLQRVVWFGRQPDLMLQQQGKPVAFQDWAQDLLFRLEPLADWLDSQQPDAGYRAALQQQRLKVQDPQQTPSGRMLADMAEQQTSFYQWAQAWSRAHQAALQNRLSPVRRQEFDQLAQQSWQQAQQLEASASPSFEEYLQAYFD